MLCCISVSERFWRQEDSDLGIQMCPSPACWSYGCNLWCRMDERSARTISLCTGMQSSTLAMLLATQFFGTTAAVPPACSVVFMALSGLTLATFWGRGYGAGPLLKSMGRNMYLSKQEHEGREMVA